MNIGVLRLHAHAKINLALEVLGRRADGYHEICTVLQTIDLHDTLELRDVENAKFRVYAPAAWCVPSGAENLAWQALVAFAAEKTAPASRRYRRAAPLGVSLTKRIPPAAGLGGGSSDAAAVLRGCATWQRSVGDTEHLESVAAGLGSDVPFFIRGGTQLATGRGELLQPLPDAEETWLVLVTPVLATGAKTARLFAALRPEDFSEGARSNALAISLKAGYRVTPARLFNTFDQIADAAFHGLAHIRRALEDRCGHALLSGAGPSLFALCRDQPEAESAAAYLRAQGLSAASARTVDAAESVETQVVDA